ncbi:MAG TPA: hypothetical protein VI792_11910 [Candidatus Eisenbacteria bacterium]
MTLRHALIAGLLAATVCVPAGAATRRAVPAARHATVAPRHAGRARTPGHVPAAGPGTEVRRLEDIHIEGEIPVPQVLFITARDQRRFLEFQHGRYLRTSRTTGEETALPAWIVVTGTRPAEDRGNSR